jgi:hypothetical protein
VYAGEIGGFFISRNFSCNRFTYINTGIELHKVLFKREYLFIEGEKK